MSVSAAGVVEPALVDPSLPLDSGHPDTAGSFLPYWPSYSEIPPSSRAAYLSWLSNGRKDPTACIGYVFLFLYGLERRVLLDHSRDPAVAAEIPVIVAELERLISVYTASRSFRKYAGRLLEVARIHLGRDIQPRHVCPGIAPTGELPFLLRTVVGGLAKEGKPLPAEWAWAWISHDPARPTRTPTRRCPLEFQALFEARYTARLGDGFALKACKTHVKVSYTAASASFSREMPLAVQVPDTTSLVDPRRSLLRLAEECCEDLEPLSRLRGRLPGSEGSIQSIAVLPTELLLTHAPPELARLRAALTQALDSRENALVKAGDLLGAWLPGPGEKPTKAGTVELLQVVHRAGCGLEPDVRFGGPVITANDRVAIFRSTESDPSTPTGAYSAASLLLHLGACVAHTDGSLSDTEQQHLREHLGRVLHLEEGERRRLSAHLLWLTSTEPETTRLKKRIESLTQDQRAAAGQFVVGVALADGHINPREVKNLQKIFKLLGFDPASVHESIHAIQSGSTLDEPTRIPAQGEPAPEYSVPAERAHAPPGKSPSKAPRKLDMALVEAKLQESAKVAAILGEILGGDDPAPTVEPDPTVAGDLDRVRTLDAAHTQLFRALGQRPSWSRDEYEGIAAASNLLPDGALETINELAFEVCDAPLFEGDDPIELDMSVYKEISK